MTIGSTDFQGADDNVLQAALTEVERVARAEPVVGIVGSVPTEEEPDLGGGYAIVDRSEHWKRAGLLRVLSFKEKPSLAEFHQLVEQGALLNLGKTVIRLEVLLKLYERFLPDYHRRLGHMSLSRAGTIAVDLREAYRYFAGLQTPFATGILEKIVEDQSYHSQEFIVGIRAIQMLWTDLGSLNRRFLDESADPDVTIVRGVRL